MGKLLRYQVHPNINANDNIEALIAEAESIKDNADAVLARLATADEAVLV